VLLPFIFVFTEILFTRKHEERRLLQDKKPQDKLSLPFSLFCHLQLLWTYLSYALLQIFCDERSTKEVMQTYLGRAYLSPNPSSTSCSAVGSRPTADPCSRIFLVWLADHTLYRKAGGGGAKASPQGTSHR
jgi:hypothetical protein